MCATQWGVAGAMMPHLYCHKRGGDLLQRGCKEGLKNHSSFGAFFALFSNSVHKYVPCGVWWQSTVGLVCFYENWLVDCQSWAQSQDFGETLAIERYTKMEYIFAQMTPE